MHDDQAKALTSAFDRLERSLLYDLTSAGSLRPRFPQHPTGRTFAAPTNSSTYNFANDKEEFIGVPASIHRPRSCTSSCPCSCHGGVNYKSPTWLSAVTGQMSLTLSGIPQWTYKSCNAGMCSYQGRSLLKVTYYFPTWCLKRMISLTSSWSPCGDFTVVMKTPRTRSPSADIFGFIQQGNIDGLKILFNNGEASPFDINAVNGRSTLNVSNLRLNSLP